MKHYAAQYAVDIGTFFFIFFVALEHSVE